MDMPSSSADGTSVRNHTNAFREAKGQPPLPGYVPPEGLEYLWNGFSELKSTRDWIVSAGPTSVISVPKHISYTEIDAWTRLKGRSLAWWEVEVLRKLDANWIRCWHERLR